VLVDNLVSKVSHCAKLRKTCSQFKDIIKTMKTVFILEHSYELNGHDETKFIGVYSTNEMAESAINRLKYKNGFKYHPDAFVITECELNKDSWTEGFATMTTIQVKSKDNTWITVEAECLPNKPLPNLGTLQQ
jgi:hypothetical protein